jgi:hypothetical protein
MFIWACNAITDIPNFTNWSEINFLRAIYAMPHDHHQECNSISFSSPPKKKLQKTWFLQIKFSSFLHSSTVTNMEREFREFEEEWTQQAWKTSPQKNGNAIFSDFFQSLTLFVSND